MRNLWAISFALDPSAISCKTSSSRSEMKLITFKWVLKVDEFEIAEGLNALPMRLADKFKLDMVG